MTLIVVLGARGMLGRALARQRPGIVALGREVDVTDPIAVYSALRAVRGSETTVINCAGVLPGGNPQTMIGVNALGPHNVADVTESLGLNVIHVSTDCVWSGDHKLARHTVATPPNPADLYGHSKVIGEVHRSHILNVRTSFIGPDHGFFRWAMEELHAGRPVTGWDEATWSGSTVDEAARALLALADVGHIIDSLGKPGRRVVTLATEQSTTKYRVLQFLAERLRIRYTIAGPDGAPFPAPVVRRETEHVIHRAMRASYSMEPVFDCLKGPEAWYFNEEAWKKNE